MYKKKQKSIVRLMLAQYAWHLQMAALAVVTLLLLGSLLTYSPKDACAWYAADSYVKTYNFFGMFGAHVSGALLFLSGGASFGLVIICMVLLSILYKQRSLRQEWDRVIASITLFIAVSALLNHYSWDLYEELTPGGLIGFRIARLVAYWFNTSGIVALIALTLASLMILGRFLYDPAMQVAFVIYQWCQRHAWIAQRVWSYAIAGATSLLALCKRFIDYLQYVLSGKLVEDHAEDFVSYEEEDPQVTLLSQITKQEALTPAQPLMHQAPQPQQSTPIVKVAPQPQQHAHEGTPPATVQQPIIPYTLPHMSMFIGVADEQDDKQLMQELEKRARLLEEKLQRFGVEGSVVAIKRGPVVTVFEYQPAIDSKLSKIVALEDDLALALQALSIRIIAPIPGRSVVGFEVANTKRKNVSFAKVIKSKAYQQSKATLPLLLGEDTIGADMVVDLARMPHLLIAGSTGSGKSVALNGMLISLLCKKNPDEMKLILIDPKRLEFAPYVDIPHLLFPIITEPKKVAPVLRYVISQMEQRYDMMSKVGARNIFDYHTSVQEKTSMPFIVVVIDELADLMMTAGRETEDLITRIAQMARAAGIHMMVATQRPSVDVITGLIKVNFPSRISFRVTSKIDSRTILDVAGADKLLGRGDMLFLDSSSASLARIHGAYVSDAEIAQVVNHIKGQRKPNYIEHLIESTGADQELLGGDEQLFEDVIAYLQTVEEISISLLQRKFRIGYNRSARIIDMLEAQGYILPSQGGKTRKVIR